MKTSTIYNQKGISLIEVLIAILILAIGIAATARMQGAAVKGNSYAGGISEATAVARDKMEQLMLLPYTHKDLKDEDGNGTGQDANQNGLDDDDEGNFVDGIRHFGLDDDTVSTPDGSQICIGTTQISYTVYWNIAVDVPAVNAIQIRVHVQYRQGRANRHLILNRVKANI